MQPAEAASQANWDAVDAAAEARESIEMVAQMFNFNIYSLPSESSHDPSLGFSSLFWSDHNNGGGEQLYVSDNGVGSMLHFWPQPAACSSQFAGGNLEPAFVPPGNSVNYQAYNNYKEGGAPSGGPLNFYTSEEQNESSLLVSVDDLLQEPAESETEEASIELNGASHSNGSQSGLVVSHRKPQPKRAKPQALETDKSDHRDDHIKDSTPSSSKKKPRSALLVSNGGKSAHKKKPSKAAASRGDAEDSSACSEEYSSSASQEIAAGGRASSTSKSSASPNSKGKTRAGLGSATDPQSLYARKRRERINERLRILQNLVPNGTKVDISTMLEEAVQYVKFLQLQIKLLSSDDLWMYAPIAYNGMNIGLDLKISPPQ